MRASMSDLRIIPSIEHLRQRDEIQRLESLYGRDSTVRALRAEAAALRETLTHAPEHVRETEDAAVHIETRLERRLRQWVTPSLGRLLNATGVIVHTNLGRAPLGRSAIARVADVASGYSNLEYDLARGARGTRSAHAAALLTHLTGAEAALVVNNNAAAVLLALATLAAGREVVISRGELVEIGGGFRIPDVMRASGATLREVGTTNRTRAADYSAAFTDRTALVLRVHPSNFRIDGFAERPPLAEVVEVSARFAVPVVEDLGSGNLFSTPALDNEPTIGDSIGAGVAACMFSGDKLLGGPQAGLIVGRQDVLERLRSHPLMRALRVDKLIYAALEATLVEHVVGRAGQTIPVVRMIDATVECLGTRAQQIVARLDGVAGFDLTIESGVSTIGGGSTPGVTLPSRQLAISLADHSAARLSGRLRRATPPVVGRIEDERVLLDLRTVAPEEDDALVEVLRGLAGDADTED